MSLPGAAHHHQQLRRGILHVELKLLLQSTLACNRTHQTVGCAQNTPSSQHHSSGNDEVQMLCLLPVISRSGGNALIFCIAHLAVVLVERGGHRTRQAGAQERHHILHLQRF